MTKPRSPLSSHSALMTIAHHIGWEQAATIAGRKERTLRKWSEDDVGPSISLEAASRLDLAYLAAGGQVAPFEAWYCLQRRLFADRALAIAAGAPAALLAAAARESGQAIAAYAIAGLPDACVRTRTDARREIDEAIAALDRAGWAIAPEARP